MFSARLPLDEKLFERDLQAALHLSKQSAEDETAAEAGWSDECLIALLLSVFFAFPIICCW